MRQFRRRPNFAASPLIEPSNSDWSNPVVMIKKPNGKYWLCLHLRKVNKITKKDLYPIPIMAEILEKNISKIYLPSAYHQIPLEEASRPITTFTVPGKGIYQFKSMPFCLRVLLHSKLKKRQYLII